MEAPAQYGPPTVRPRLTVIRVDGADAPYCALPHAIVRRADISRDARLLVAVLQMYGWKDGDCTASHATLAADMGCGLKSLRGYLDELIAAGIITEREAGVRRQKVYTLAVNTSKTTHWTPVNTAETTDCPPSNAQVLPVQCVVLDDFNTSKTTHSKKKQPGKKQREETVPPPGVGAAVAADPPAGHATTRRSSRGTPCPETFPLDARHYDYAAQQGYVDRAQVAAITDAFVTHHRFKGTIGRDWYAGWQGWIRRQRQIDDERASRRPSSQQRNGVIPPGAASKQKSDWSGFKGRYGGNMVAKGPDDGR